MPYLVQYRCIYREYWYDYAEAATWADAVAIAGQLEQLGRAARITDSEKVLYQTS